MSSSACPTSWHITSGVGDGREPTTIFRSPYAPAQASQVARPDGSGTPLSAVMSSSSGTPPGPTKMPSRPAASLSLICWGSSASRSMASTASSGTYVADSHCRHSTVSSVPQFRRPSRRLAWDGSCAWANGSRGRAALAGRWAGR